MGALVDLHQLKSCYNYFTIIFTILCGDPRVSLRDRSPPEGASPLDEWRPP